MIGRFCLNVSPDLSLVPSYDQHQKSNERICVHGKLFSKCLVWLKELCPGTWKIRSLIENYVYLQILRTIGLKLGQITQNVWVFFIDSGIRPVFHRFIRLCISRTCPHRYACVCIQIHTGGCIFICHSRLCRCGWHLRCVGVPTCTSSTAGVATSGGVHSIASLREGPCRERGCAAAASRITTAMILQMNVALIHI